MERDLKTWEKPDHTPKKNGRKRGEELEELIVSLVKDEFDASYTQTARHAAFITGEKVSANLVIGVRKRNDLEKPRLIFPVGKIRSQYEHTVSVDVLREEELKIFGFIQDKTRISMQHLSTEHTAAMALEALKEYIRKYGKPDAVRCDNGSEFKGVFKEYLLEQGIKMLNPLPYNPGANGFIERYFRTLRADLLNKLKKRGIKVTQQILDDYTALWNHCRVNNEGKTPAELAGLSLKRESLNRFKFTKKTVANWSYWHITGVHDFLHAYMPESKLKMGFQAAA